VREPTWGTFSKYNVMRNDVGELHIYIIKG
jgi:hypothetical protein